MTEGAAIPSEPVTSLEEARHWGAAQQWSLQLLGDAGMGSRRFLIQAEIHTPNSECVSGFSIILIASTLGRAPAGPVS